MTAYYSRRAFLTGVLTCGTVSAATAYLLPGGHGDVTLTLATGKDPSGAIDVLIKRWNERNRRIRVVLDQVPGHAVDEHDGLLDRARAGRADILNLDVVYIPEFAANGLIAPVELTDGGDFVGRNLAPGRIPEYPDHYWAVPYRSDVGMMFTWHPSPDDPGSLRDVVDRVPDGSGRLVAQLLLGAGDRSYEPFVVNVLEHGLAAARPVLDDLGVVYDLDTWREALQPLKIAMARSRITATETEDQSTDKFCEKNQDGLKYKFMRNWPVQFNRLKQKDDVDTSPAGLRVAPLGSGARNGPGILGGSSLAVVARSPYHAEAVEVIKFLTADPQQKELAMRGLVPSRRGVFDDEDVRKRIPHIGLIRTEVDKAVPRPVNPNYLRFSSVVRQHVGAFLDDTAPLSEKFVDDMRRALSWSVG